MPTHKRLIPSIIVLIAVISVFSYAQRDPSMSHMTVETPIEVIANVTFKVGETIYPINVLSGGTVIDTMHALASTDAFSFTGRDYPGLGFFIDSINGKKNADGKYWILYLNDVVATTGVSMTTINADDTIEWKYEKGY